MVRPMNPRAPMTVMYSDRVQAPAQADSPSAAKPAQVVADWRAAGIPLRVVAPDAATVDELSLAHDRAHVEAVLSCARDNGFGTRDAAVAASLPYTTGAMLHGARVALAECAAVCAPVSGFHHAGWSTAWGYCTFNGLMVTALALRAAGLARRVAIVDCDQHHGDGTDAIVARLGASSWVRHFSAGRWFRRARDVPEFFARLDAELRAAADCDVLLYQAGADPHVDDPLGGWLTTAQLRARDACVFEAVAARRQPLVWNLAGGYQRDPDGGIRPVLEVHRNTALEHARVFCG